MNDEELFEYLSDEGHICYEQVLFIQLLNMFLLIKFNNYNNYFF